MKVKVTLTAAALVVCQYLMAQIGSTAKTTLKRSGYIIEVLEAPLVAVNFKNAFNIGRETIEIGPNTLITRDDQPLLFSSLRAGMEVLVEGEFYNTDKANVPKKVTVSQITKRSKTIRNGQLDLIKDGVGYVSGHKVRLRNDVEIKGKKGYKGKQLNGFEGVKPGDVLKVNGTYSDGFYNTSEIKVSPEPVTKFDAMADTIDQKIFNHFYPAWTQPANRKSFFNQTIKGYGRVVGSEKVQQYVNEVGLKLIPEHYQSKIHFLFVVVDNKNVQASVRPNGLAIINSGLLLRIENESQLAAVLAHEIAHCLYKHSAQYFQMLEEVETMKANSEKNKASNKEWVDKNKKKIANSKDNSKNKKTEKVLYGAVDAINVNSDVLVYKKVADFSVGQESEADKVGLSLMAAAGYDPRENVNFWKNIFNDYGGIGHKRNFLYKLTATGIVTYNETQKNKSDDFDPKKNSIENIGGNVATKLLANESAYIKEKSYETSHPDDLERFEDLNRLLEMYWSDKSLLDASFLGDDAYLVIKNTLIQSLNQKQIEPEKSKPTKAKKTKSKK